MRPCLDEEVAAILARLRGARIICCGETSVRLDGVGAGPNKKAAAATYMLPGSSREQATSPKSLR
jgi:hypothetical protein